MGVVGSKSPLERRNTVLRRSQRKSIHGVKSKTDKLVKDIKKFKGTEENTTYIDLKARIETLDRDLKNNSKNLQPQIRHIHNETAKKIEECQKLLDDKLKENQDKQAAKAQLEQKALEEKAPEKDNDSTNDDVFIEDITEEERKLEPSEKRQTVELKLIQVEPIEASPQINKRFSAMKIGVPVMPGSMMESLHTKTVELNAKAEERVAEIRKEIEKLEMEISQFVGRKNGKFYNKIKARLESFANDLKGISFNDDVIAEQIKMCGNYIGSCLSFLDEKVVDEDVDGDDDDDDDEVTASVTATKSNEEVGVDRSLSPRTLRTTYI